MGVNSGPGARLLVVVSLIAAFVTLGWASAGAAAQPGPDRLGSGVIAYVSDVPRALGTITVAEFRHAFASALAQSGYDSAPKPGGRAHEGLEATAIGALLDEAWLKGEAAEMGIDVTRGEVKRKLGRLKSNSFESEADYQRFRRESGYTQRDVFIRVELQILATRIQMQVLRDADEGEGGQAFKEFVAAYNTKWRSRTVCVPEYAIRRCSNGP